MGYGMSNKERMILKAAKAELTIDQWLMFDQEYKKKKKTMVAAYLLGFFLGSSVYISYIYRYLALVSFIFLPVRWSVSVESSMHLLRASR
jgi:hypothetical protein